MDLMNEKLGKKIRRWAIYLILGRATDALRIISNQLCRLSFGYANYSKSFQSNTPPIISRSRAFINIMIPNLHDGNSFPKLVARHFDRKYLVEEYFPSKRRSLNKRNSSQIEIFHLHFIDQMKLDYSQTITLIDELRAANIKIVVTAHDLTPHTKQPEIYDPLFQAWLGAADGIIHHSHWGADILQSRYRISAGTKHAIISFPGGQGKLRATTSAQRTFAEISLGLKKIPIRIGIVGAPRRERLVTEFLEGFAKTERDDLEIACWSLDEHDIVPRDPRIVIAERYKHVSNYTFRMRLRACDVIAIPYQKDGEMLTTGVVNSALDAGIGVLRTDWPFLKEVFGDAGIYVGSNAEGFAMGLSRLTVEDVESAKRASLELRASNNWRRIAQQYGIFYESLFEDGAASLE
ncbi:MAG: hypothetical protein ABSE82_02650 [Nitrososphaerales archaeon]